MKKLLIPCSIFAVLTVVFAVINRPAECSVGLLKGDRASFWERYALLLVRIDELGIDRVAGGERIRFTCVATVTGRYDTGVHTSLLLPFTMAGATAFTERPDPGSFALVLVGRKIVDKDGTLGEFFLPNAIVEFLPSRCAIWEFDGLDDEMLLKVTESVAALRQKGLATAK